MEYIRIGAKFQKSLEKILKKYPLVKKIVKQIDKEGGQTLLVGGAVRDLLLGLPVKDLDIEVHHVSLNKLEKILKEFGPVSKVGKIFGVLRLHGLDVDWSVPRTDTSGRKPKVTIDPFMGIKKAFARRDLTINAMGIDLITHELIDPFGGWKDLKKGVLKATDAKFFVEDPLRFFRVMQFVGRFGMKPSKKLNDICKAMDISKVSRERIETEFEKLLLKSPKPSLGIVWLDAIGRLEDVLPELAATKGIKQEKKWHPEGDVFEHSMQSLDAAAALEYNNEQEKLAMLYAALCHDLGKVTTTEKIDGVIKSLGHEIDSEKFAKKLLRRITRNRELTKKVSKLVRYHMHPLQFVDGGAKHSAYKRLAIKLAPEINLQLLGKLSLIDRRGRNAKKGKPLKKNFKDIDEFLKKAKKAKVLEKLEAPVLQGKDLLKDIDPGPEMGRLLKQAYQIQLDEGIKDKKQLKKRVLSK